VRATMEVGLKSAKKDVKQGREEREKKNSIGVEGGMTLSASFRLLRLAAKTRQLSSSTCSPKLLLVFFFQPTSSPVASYEEGGER